MPTPRKSKTELAVSGTLQNQPGRYRARFEPAFIVIRPIGRPPAHYAAQQRTVWAELIRHAPEGVLTRHDRIAVEVAVSLLLKVRSGHAKTADVAALTAILAKLAMTPADRKRMNYETPLMAQPDPDDDDWDSL